ncbi:hypothetical protein B0J18DRAFT_439841 [Chaetomium sp. MPI-SDFR-AT-0129]|nr:hypothetical protein B0J18DRAFT_439841 [Chaetomium sp. MPI-SDFR-AT-0129]
MKLLAAILFTRAALGQLYFKLSANGSDNQSSRFSTATFIPHIYWSDADYIGFIPYYGTPAVLFVDPDGYLGDGYALQALQQGIWALTFASQRDITGPFNINNSTGEFTYVSEREGDFQWVLCPYQPPRYIGLPADPTFTPKPPTVFRIALKERTADLGVCLSGYKLIATPWTWPED